MKKLRGILNFLKILVFLAITSSLLYVYHRRSLDSRLLQGLEPEVNLETLGCSNPIGVIGSPRMTCKCKSTNMQMNSKNPGNCSLCSDEATSLGPSQKVISYSLFESMEGEFIRVGKIVTDYRRGILENLKTMRSFYPGWVMRVYSDFTLTPGSEICNHICDNPRDLYWCDVDIDKIKANLPWKMANQSQSLPPVFWRFFPIVDPLVSIFLSRDLDSVLGMRERGAVDEWVKRENKTIHLMRDHYKGHKVEVMAGMWGVKLNISRMKERGDMMQEILENIMEDQYYGVDQMALTKAIYNEKYFNRILAHDSNFCEIYNQTECLNFPQPYEYQDGFVGMENENEYDQRERDKYSYYGW